MKLFIWGIYKTGNPLNFIGFNCFELATHKIYYLEAPGKSPEHKITEGLCQFLSQRSSSAPKLHRKYAFKVDTIGIRLCDRFKIFCWHILVTTSVLCRSQNGAPQVFSKFCFVLWWWWWWWWWWFYYIITIYTSIYTIVYIRALCGANKLCDISNWQGM